MNATTFRRGLEELGFDVKPGNHPIVPSWSTTPKRRRLSSPRLLELGFYVVGFFYPVVPKGQARLRMQLSAAHSDQDLADALCAFETAGKELEIVR